MKNDRQQYVYLGLAAVLIVTGTLATGLFPSSPFYQALAGGIIVVGFAIGYVGLGAFEFLR